METSRNTPSIKVIAVATTTKAQPVHLEVVDLVLVTSLSDRTQQDLVDLWVWGYNQQGTQYDKTHG